MKLNKDKTVMEKTCAELKMLGVGTALSYKINHETGGNETQSHYDEDADHNRYTLLYVLVTRLYCCVVHSLLEGETGKVKGFCKHKLE